MYDCNKNKLNSRHKQAQQTDQRSLTAKVGAAVVGLTVTGTAYAVLPFLTESFNSRSLFPITALVALGCLVGFLLRVGRRHLFFSIKSSFHQMFSFEAIFQGAIAFNPQLEYPGVESAFLNRSAKIPYSESEDWFKVRLTSAVAIPLAIGGVALAFAGHIWASVLCFVVCCGWIFSKTRGVSRTSNRSKFLVSEIFGILAALTEGWAFALACMLIDSSVGVHYYLGLYLILLSVYEFSPVAFALGILELVYLGIVWIAPIPLAGLVVVFVYRLFRFAVVLLGVLYLPRYKLNLKDVFNPELSLILKRHNRPEGGWPGAESAAGNIGLSIVIPAFNEAKRLPDYLPEVVKYCEQQEFGCEILVVDDGSTDATAEYVKEIAGQHSIVGLLKQTSNLGKGAAVKRGALEAVGEYILFADADGATPIREADALLTAAKTGIEVVIASRAARDGKTKRSFLRSLLGTTFYRLTNLLAVPMVSDTQCGFKMFRNFAAKRIFSQVKETGWAFDVEVLFLAQKYDYAIKEVPVEWNAVPGSKINLVGDSLGMLWAIWRIRKRSSGMTDME